MAILLFLRGAMGAGKSSIANRLKERSPQLDIIEIDNIKTEKYDTTEKCDPPVDFKAVGARAKLSLDSGKNVVVIEPLCEQEHINYVLEGANLSTKSPHILSIWLHCSPQTAIARKKQSHEISVIESQYLRYSDRIKLKNEMIIHTDACTVDDVTSQVIDYIQQNKKHPQQSDG